MEAPELQDNIARMAATGPIKVWSVVVTVLGDLLRAPDATLGGRQLDALLSQMGINNQALRVALHRLRNDGWVQTAKDGRRSRHRLTAMGWAETEAVWPAIYTPPTPLETVTLLLGDPQMSAAEFATQLPQGAVVLTQRSALISGDGVRPIDCLATPFQSDGLPDWVRNALAPAELCAEYQALTKAVTAVPDMIDTDIIAQTAMRLAILHHWRRLRLRHGGLPDAVLGETWAGAEARTAVFAALEQLPRPTLQALEAG